MQSLLTDVAVLACPVGMTLMMWMMMRGHGKYTGASEDHGWLQEVHALRAEIEQLKAQRTSDRSAGGP